ncbi:MAG: flagellar hook assembly protein FlgD [Gammaproteobacteria bacterium]|nr:flagellar hook assembly protein FlgD [Gammaproteobacteria bacterium]
MATVDSISNQNQFHELLQTDNEATLEADKTDSERDQADFMTLMIAQLQNQNPLDPQDGAEFLSQLAQINSVEQLISLNTSVGDLSTEMRSSQALQATSLVGRKVLIESSIGVLDSNGGISGKVDLPQSTNEMIVSITDVDGNLVKEIKLGSQAPGEVPFYWDGYNYANAVEGEEAPRFEPGPYVVSAIYSAPHESDTAGAAVGASTFLYSNVDSVSLGPSSGVQINTLVGQFSIEDVKEVSDE